jgi:hypothetical protein
MGYSPTLQDFYSAWALLAAGLAVLVGAELASAIANGDALGFYAIALAISVTTFNVALRRLRGKPVLGGAATGVILTLICLLIVAVMLLGAFLRGPL